MIVWLTQTGEPYPFQNNVVLMRTGLLAQELHRQGHTIVWWGSTFYHQRKRILFNRETVLQWAENYSIRLLDGGSYAQNVSIKRYLFHKRVARRFALMARSLPRPDVIVASLPAHDLAYEAIKYANENEIPSVVDVRDLWPDFFVNRFSKLFRPLLRVILSCDFRRASKALMGASAVLGISETYLKWALAYAKRERRECDRVLYIGSKSISSNKDHLEIRSQYGVPFARISLTFIGSFGETSDLVTVVRAARQLHEIGRRDIHFILVGDGQNYNRIKNLAYGLPNISLLGWLDNDQIRDVLAISDIGIAPYGACAPQSLPNKPFQYAAAGIPILCSLDGELADIIKKFEMGLIYKPNNPSALVSSIITLADNNEQRNEMGNNALYAFESCFDARTIYRNYSELIASIAVKGLNNALCY